MNKLKITGIVVLGLIVLALAVSQLLPRQWKVRRSLIVSAPPGALLPYLADFKTGWPQWSAFDSEDPAIQFTYSGPDAGPGASRSWISKKMGNGSQSILRADSKGVAFALHMDPAHFDINGEFAFEPAPGGTKITWTDSGAVGFNPAYRYMASFMDRMLGPAFEKSLTTLKQRVEHPAKP